MASFSDALAILARLYLQTLGLSLVFIGAGEFVYRKWADGRAATEARGVLSLQWGRGYFLGLSIFLFLFLFLSRVVGARAALWLALPLMGSVALFEALARRQRPSRSLWPLLGLLLSLVVVYSVTNAALWLTWGFPPDTEPDLLLHFGSLHSGRYANYAIFVAEHDRVPFLAQNGGQSMLASVHLILGLNSPLAALMVWVPVSLAFLTILIFGLFRSEGFAAGSSTAATFLVMFCNVAVSAVHVLVFDNGSPLAFIGYTDMISAVGTFLVFCRWLQGELVRETEAPHARFLLPGLVGTTWTWYAPQNVVVGLPTLVATALIWRRWYPEFQVRRRLLASAVALALGAGLGALQFGTLLPHGLREDTGLWTQDVEPTIAIRPYTQYMTSHWSGFRWNPGIPTGSLVTNLYERTYVEARQAGRDQIYRSFVWLVEEHLWASVRVYGFPLLGLVVLGACTRRGVVPPGRERRAAWRSWLLLSFFAFGIGYVLYFSLEVGGMKWWLTRFLVPGTAMTLIGLGYGTLGGLARVRPAMRRAIWAFLVVMATAGPVVEVATVAVRNFVIGGKEAPVGQRLMLLVRSKGPFLEQPAYRADPSRQP
jgi:hypothetical protein